jgi:pyruvate/2-oxoglutarate dehydrogenase complex dihydrolipoamide acyltransferase (E2) component
MPRIPILMPQLGESIAEATIVQLLVTQGERVTADQEIMEVETQKATMSVTTPCDGVIGEFICTTGVSYPVGSTLVSLEVSEEDAQRHGPAPEPTGRPEVEEKLHFKINPDDDYDSLPPEQVIEDDLQVRPTIVGLPVPVSATGATYLSPRMRARMQELGINAADMAGIAGSGAAGRVTVDDFERFIAEIEKSKMTIASPMRIAVADSMRRSWTRPLATVGAPVRMDKMLAHRKTMDPKPGPALYIVRALALALAENTAIAGRLIGERIVHPSSIDIGFAVEVEDGVLVPVIRDADQQPLADMVEKYNGLVEAARRKRLPPDATKPGIATVTNFGTFGIAWATPIPLPEQNLVLGLGKGSKRPCWDEETETWVPKTEAAITLSFDHRVLDGGAAGRLLARLADLLQTPEIL